MTVKQALCGVILNHGGDGGMMKIENGRLYTECYDCGWESPGVTVTVETPAPTARVRMSWRPYIMLLKWARGID